MTPGSLDAALLAAHARSDLSTLVRLYTLAAERAADAAEENFFLTQAYVFALEAGDATAELLHARLHVRGCED